MEITRHVAYLLGDPSGDEGIEYVELPEKVKHLVGISLASYRPLQFDHVTSPLDAVSSYFCEVDPLGLIESNNSNADEYLLEADACLWLLQKGELTIEIFWALWIYFFDSETSPFKSPDDELLIAMHQRVLRIYALRLSNEEIEKVRIEAQTPWMGASIAWLKFQSKIKWLKFRKGMRNSNN